MRGVSNVPYLQRREVGDVNNNITSKKRGNVRFISYFTNKNGVKHYAKDHGLKAFPVTGPRKKKA